ncbi:MAG: hypothetical protein HYV39_01770 [Candidatus Levybacteria bacterium]|nr:hypothetical protein [Candidatus Levybacteria bacterium]
MTRSRLSRRLERQTKKSIILSVLGIVLTLVLLAKFGIPFLANVSYLLLGGKDTPEIKIKNMFVSPPVFDALPSATNSANLKVSGNASEKQIITLYINGEVVDKTDTNDRGLFEFDDIKLSEGENLIQAKAKNNDKDKQESDFSSSYTVIFKKNAPSLSIDSPSPNQSFSKDDKFATVRGKTDPGVRITVNDFWAIVDSEGSFSYNLPLKGGENKIKVVAIDEAENKTEKEVTVTSSQ